MAEIDIERKPKQRWWPWALAALLLLAVVGTTWFLAGPQGARLGTDTDTVSTFTPYEPGSGLDRPVPPSTSPDPGRPAPPVP